MFLRKIPFILLFFIVESNLFGQEKPILVFDLELKTFDSIPQPLYDTAILYDTTTRFIGNFDSKVERLNDTIPLNNLFFKTQFTRKIKVSDSFDINKYPIRTNVKIVGPKNDTLLKNCSGSLISRKHVLTSAFCVLDMYSNNIKVDSVNVFPAFNDGKENENFGSSQVKKIYFFKDWNIVGEDFAVLELEQPLGEKTGWISIGFNEVDSSLKEGMFYKFSFPNGYIPSFDSTRYNGDTLFFNYGKVSMTSDAGLFIPFASGIPGDNGSSIIKIENKKKYISYGVLSYISLLYHSRINKREFYAIKNIIDDQLYISPPELKNGTIQFFPNPTNQYIFIDNQSEYDYFDVILYDKLGRKIKQVSLSDSKNKIDVSMLPKGIYIIIIFNNNVFNSGLIVKQ